MEQKKSEWDYSVKGHYNPVKAVENGWPIRLSKSSFMTYLMCPRKYWWQNVELEGIRTPPTEYMIHGSAVHHALENMYGNIEKNGVSENLRPLFDIDPEDELHEPYKHSAVDSLSDLETQRLESWGATNFRPLEFEVKHEYRTTVEWENEDGTTGSYPVVLVGKIDGVVQHPETGDLALIELKTGKLSTTKQTRTRKELAYYAFMLESMGRGKTSHFLYLYPECTNEKIVYDLLEKEMKGKIEVWLNDSEGIGYIEPFGKRTQNAFMKSLSQVVKGLATMDWKMNWSDWFCNNYCDFNMACETEIMGAGWSLEEHVGEWNE